MPTYYDILKVASTASVAEIEATLDAQYHQCRRLVTHHKPEVANKATLALRKLEQMRATLTDPARRANYDASLGLGGNISGLADPQARSGSATLPVPPAPRLASSSATPVVGSDAWICPNCQMANAIGMQFCKHCGTLLARKCPGCNRLIPAGAAYCPECGINIEQAAYERRQKAEIETKQKQQREQALAEKQATENRQFSSLWARSFGFGKQGNPLISAIVGAILGLLANAVIIVATPNVSDLQVVAQTALNIAPMMGLICGGITGMLAVYLSEHKPFSASEFGTDVAIGASSGVVQTILLLIIGYISMDGLFLTIIYIVTVLPTILALIAMFSLVASTILAGLVWGVAFGIIRWGMWQFVKAKSN